MFKDKTVIITGASNGIGEELARQLAAQGARLSLAARNQSKLESVAAECRKLGAEVLVVVTDVAIEEDCRRLIDETVETFGGIDILFNNAGISMWTLFEEVKDLSIFKKIMDVNYMGSLYCTHYALPYLKKSRGRIVANSSLTGKNGVPTRSGYAASKHAMVGFFDTLRIELEEYGISVTTVYPDFVATDMRVNAFGPDGKPLGKSPVQESKVMTAEECCRLILKATSDRKRDLLMSTRAKVGLWVKLIAPKLVDNIAKKAIARGK